MLPIWASEICNLEKIDLRRITAPTTTLRRTEKHNPAIFCNEKLYPMADQLFHQREHIKPVLHVQIASSLLCVGRVFYFQDWIHA